TDATTRVRRAVGSGAPERRRAMTEITVLTRERAPQTELPAPAPAEEVAVPTHPLARRARGWTLWLIVIGLLVWSWGPAEMFRATSLFTDWQNMAEVGRAFLRPKFHEWRGY